MSNQTAREIGKREWLALAGFVVICFAVAAFGSIFSPDDWYRNLEKPSFQPPDWLFAPVWTVLYGLIAVSGWLVWRKSADVRTAPALNAYGLQLILNGAWSWLFFGLHRPGLALVDIVLLWISILATIVLFWRISRPAAVLMIPYLAWVSFAAALNFALWRLNA